ncbi:MAG: DUF2087 domain-containing protein [Actinomycetota bacterium]|nr:DUF2087 domain-containing protein [Actinomycetota bacterium]
MDAEPSATKPAVVAIAPEAWRAVLAALVNPRLRGALAEAITEGDPALTAAERRDARRILTRSGLLTPGGQLDERRLRAMLAGNRTEKEGVDRWLRADGRIDRWPTRADDRLELLSWIAERLMGTDEVLAEKPFTLKLFAFTTDPNTLRRALVDTGLIDRNADGTDYRRVAGAL